jgi:hypothetical protein
MAQVKSTLTAAAALLKICQVSFSALQLVSAQDVSYNILAALLSSTTTNAAAVCRSWVVKANVVHYSWGALMINQYEGQRQSRLGSMNVLAYFGFSAGDAWMHLAIVVGFFFGWSFLTWLALAYARSYRR